MQIIVSLHNINPTRSTDSLSSVAKDRGWFTEYTPFETEVGSRYGPGTSRVIGIGTVELLTEPSPFSQGLNLPRPLRLTNVLHAPSVVCNVIGFPIVHDYNVSADFAGRVTRGQITDKEGRQIAYFDPSRNLLEVKLRDPPPGTYPLMQGGLYMINARWSVTERAKWDAHQIEGPLSKEEKSWLKKHFGNEFRFLREFGFSIYKEEDRADGRALLRTIMREDEE